MKWTTSWASAASNVVSGGSDSAGACRTSTPGWRACIAATNGADGGCLGLPLSDEEPWGSGRVSQFERGRIEWKPGWDRGRITCY
jgi:uncharacterized protein with LGFP repeats